MYCVSGDRSVIENNFHKYRIMYLKSAGLIIGVWLREWLRLVLVAFSQSVFVFAYNHLSLHWFIPHHINYHFSYNFAGSEVG